MANLTITPASVLISGSSISTPKAYAAAGVTVAQGEVLAKDADKNLILAAANGSALAKVPCGIALNGAGPGQPVNYVSEDPDFAPGATVVEGVTYILSATPGNICPDADGATGMLKTVIGVGKAGNKLNLKFLSGGTLA